MKTLTNNQKQALTFLAKNIVEKGDIYAERFACGETDLGDWTTMSEMLSVLTNNGWNQKEAEGTLGSLTPSYIDIDDDNGLSYEGEKVVWLVHYTKEQA